ncbi:MAG: hypothetical protein QOI53_2695 [Verrucomicrobiota bacterium]|jgi:hypothetical protein|nr:hypothetical protein [Verrucomicrobiota bacterium]
MMEFRFDFLSTVEFRPRLSTSELPEKQFEQNGRRLVPAFCLVCTRDRERRGEGIQPGRGLASPAEFDRFLFVGGLRNKPQRPTFGIKFGHGFQSGL